MEAWLNLFRRTPREYYADFLITPPITAVLLWISLQHATGFWPLMFCLGVALWTFYEYIAHRFIAHRVPFFKEAHALHHARQRDYISLHPIMTLAIYAALWMVFGMAASAVSVGFSVGYIVYSIVHTAFHYATIDPGHFLYGPKMRHVLHHRADVNFGVTTSLWDRVFNSEGIIRFH